MWLMARGGRNLAGGPDAEIVKWGALGDHPTPYPHEMAPYRAVLGFHLIHYYITARQLGRALDAVRRR